MEKVESHEKRIVVCKDEKCECILNALLNHGFEFRPGIWDSPVFELMITEDFLVIDIYNDTGQSELDIPLNALNPQLKNELTKCLSNHDVMNSSV